MASGDPSVWVQAYDQMPPLIRWIFGVLSLGTVSLAVWVYKRERQSARRVEEQVHKRIDRLEDRISSMESSFNSRFDEMNRHLTVIARNSQTWN